MSEPHEETKTADIAQSDSDSHPELDSSILASYKVISVIGQGGFGIVYKAEHKSVPGFVALKLVKKDVANSETAFKRLGQEARAITTLDHPNIVGVREFGTGNQGSAYLAMEYVDGEGLSDRLARGPMPRREALDIAIQICRGLSYAHSKGILHRDLKPHNIILDTSTQGQMLVKLVDFGIAKIRNEVREQNLTQTGDIVGSPYYMSPEQGQGFPLDERSDVYSLGCVLYELCTGDVPMKGLNAMQTLLKHINDAPVKPSDKAPALGIPKELDDVILKCLEKDPADRYQNVDDLKDDLQLLCEGKSPVGIGKKKIVKKQAKAHPVVLASRAISIVFIICALLGLYYFFPVIFKPHWLKEMDVAASQRAVGNNRMAKATLIAAYKEASEANAPDADKSYLLGELGKICRDEDRYEEAKGYYEQAVPLAEKAGLTAKTAEYLDDLALSQNETGDSAAGLKNAEKALALKLSTFGENSFYTSNSLQKKAKVHYTLGQYDKAEADLKRSRAIEEKISQGLPSTNLATIDWLLCKALLAQEKLDEAKKYYDESIKLNTETVGAQDEVVQRIKQKYERLMAMPAPKLDTMLITAPPQKESKPDAGKRTDKEPPPVR